MIKKILFSDLNDILNIYSNLKNTFELAGIIDKKNFSHASLKTYSVLIICDNSDIELIKNFDILRKFQKIYFFTKNLYNPLEWQEWCSLSKLSTDLKFDLVINFFSPRKIQNYNLLFFILNDFARGIFIFLDRNSFYDIKKMLIELDLKILNSAIQRFQSSFNLESLFDDLKIFKNCIITSEEIVLEDQNLQEFLTNKENKWFFLDEHFKNLDHLFNINEKLDINVILDIVIYKKNIS